MTAEVTRETTDILASLNKIPANVKIIDLVPEKVVKKPEGIYSILYD
jgi:hypothetical protein